MTQEEKNEQVIREFTRIFKVGINDGKIAEHWVELSMFELLQQIGALPQPG
jgi:predicted SnoaL-like aldol condensation-catalyzing enzyme